ncbi:aquaporin-9-like [Schistocerca gregaria]|uniref:aquaporin-9-like n=2 Tax=Schistocerca TaxID=7008 RepID=UPI00211EBBA6|nr:aquaporin-9-like [Schistocerca gregaria]
MDIEKVGEKLGTKRQWLKEFLSELAGSFLLVFVGSCCVAQKVLRWDVGNFITANMGYGFGLMLAVLISGPSGSHLNPAVTLAFCVIGKKPWKDCLHYFPAQYLGCFIGAAFAYIVYLDALYNFDHGDRQVTGPLGTAGIFTTYPAPYLSLVGAFINEVMATFVLLLVICAIIDENNCGITPALIPLYIGILIVTIGNGFSANTGSALNPARDLGPRIFVTIAGWGTEAFVYANYWWVPIAGPHLGGILGALFYVFFVEMHHNKS